MPGCEPARAVRLPRVGIAGGPVCAVHQPNFFPWAGFFDKIRRADVFVFLDAVDYPKSGSGMGSWVNRALIDIQGRPAWFGCPVRRRPGPQPIREVEIDDAQPWRRRLLRTLELNYRHAPGFGRAIRLLQPLIEFPAATLAQFNEHAICRIAGELGLDRRFVRQSQLPVAGRGTGLLVEIVKAVGATCYLAGGGAGGYQRDALFAANGIALMYQNFTPTPYREPARFLPGLSVIDHLMWDADCGREPAGRAG
jgi:hypothetical protein